MEALGLCRYCLRLVSPSLARLPLVVSPTCWRPLLSGCTPLMASLTQSFGLLVSIQLFAATFELPPPLGRF